MRCARRFTLTLSLVLAVLIAGARLFGHALPDGGQIAYSRSDRREVPNLWLLDLRTSIRVNMTPSGAGRGIAPEWSPDGRQLAYFGGERVTQLIIYDTATRQSRVLVRGTNASSPVSAAWSPAGDRLALVQGGSFVTESVVTLVGLDGAGMGTPMRDSSDPAWLPGGQRLTARSVASGPLLWFFDADGAQDSALVLDSLGYLHALAWSPDGEHVALSATLPGGSLQDVHLYVLDAACLPGCLAQAHPIIATRYSDAEPDWSPDGTRIVYTCHDGLNTELCIIGADGGGWQQITHSERYVTHASPAWRPR